MTQHLHASIRDDLHDEIMAEIKRKRIRNRSEFVEKLLRLGLKQYWESKRRE